MIVRKTTCSLIAMLAIASLPSLAPAAEEELATSTPPEQAVTTVDPQLPIDQLEIMVRPLTRAELEIEADAWFRLLTNKARQISAARLGVRITTEAISARDQDAAQASLDVAATVAERATADARQTEQEITDAARKNRGVDLTPVEADQPPSDEPAADSSDQSAAERAVQQLEAAPSEPPSATKQTATKVRRALLSDVSRLQNERTAIADRLKVVLDSLERKGGDTTEYRQYIAAVSGLDLDTSDITAAWRGMWGWLVSQEGGQRVARNFARFLIIMLVTWVVARLAASAVNWMLDRKLRLTQLAERLIARTIKNVILLVGFAIALTALEVDVTPIVATIGAAGLVIGLALQSTLSNFASGLMILINRPFDVGNVVTAGGITGTVDQMNLVSTTFRTFDNQTIHVPNNEIWNNVIINITANRTRRVDLEFGIGYDDDFEQAEQIIKQVVADHELVLDDPAPVVVTHALADSSVNIVCRPWAKTSDFWQVKTEVTREVKRRFDRAGITIPYPQRDVHIHTTDGARPPDRPSSGK